MLASRHTEFLDAAELLGGQRHPGVVASLAQRLHQAPDPIVFHKQAVNMGTGSI